MSEIQSISQNNYILQAPPPSATMFTTALEYDGDKISGYAGSAFKAGDEFPQSATEAIEAVTANSGAWGGSALPISAGPGIKFDMVNGTLVASTDETVLYSGIKTDVGNDGYATYPLSESPTNFNKIKIYWCMRNNSQFEQGNKGVGSLEYDPNIYSADQTYVAAYMNGEGSSGTLFPYRSDSNILNIRTTTWSTRSRLVRLDDNAVITNNAAWFHIYKIIGVNRIAGGN